MDQSGDRDGGVLPEERIQVWLARAGLGSRRSCEALIREGRVTLHGRVVELGEKTDRPEGLKLDGRRIRLPEQQRSFAFHKPRGVVSTLSDPQGRPSVADFLPPHRGRLFPVGRLDFGSEGLMLFTSDGQLAQRILHPRWGVEKEYAVKVKGELSERQLEKLRRGVSEGGQRLQLQSITFLQSRSKHSWYSIVLRGGKNRQIRRMLMVVKARVMRLKRVRIGSLRLEELGAGELRELEPREVKALWAAARRPERGGRSKKRRAGGGSRL